MDWRRRKKDRIPGEALHLDKQENAINVIQDLGLPFRDKAADLCDLSEPKYRLR